MVSTPELTDDVVIELAREGGLVYMPKFIRKQCIEIAQLNTEQRQRLDTILRQALPLGQRPGLANSPGEGDQRFYRLQITWTARQKEMQLLIPENQAPESLQRLCREGKTSICKP
ncbi:hypothetical protein BK797_02215 [Kosakonia sacchari]|nr:hypothetical protein BK797_02215 [Kosakonia sacchari]